MKQYYTISLCDYIIKRRTFFALIYMLLPQMAVIQGASQSSTVNLKSLFVIR